MASPCFWIYMLECENGAFYTGYSTNLVRRFRQHIDGTAGVKYTRTNRPVRLSQCWRLYDSVGSALKVEKCIKTAGRPVKERLIGDPARLAKMVASRLELEIRIEPFDAPTVETAARALAPEEIRTAEDPFAGVAHTR